MSGRLRVPGFGRRAGRRATGGVAAATGPAALRVAADHVRVGDGYAATLAVTGYPAEVGLAWLEPLIGLARPRRRRPAHRPDASAVGGVRAAPATGPAGVDPPVGRRPGTAGRPADRGRRRRRRGPGRPAGPRAGPTVPGRDLPDRARPDPRGPGRRGRRRAGRRRVGAAGHPTGDLAAAAGLDLHPAARPRRAAAAPGVRHRRPRRGVPAGLPGPARRRCPANPPRPAACCTG